MNFKQIQNNLTVNFPQVWNPVFAKVQQDYPGASVESQSELTVVRIAAAVQRVNKERGYTPSGDGMLTLSDLTLDKEEKA